MTNNNNTEDESEIEVSTNNQLPQPTTGMSASRRDLLKGIGATAGATATGGLGLTYGAEEAEAIIPAVLAGAGLVYYGYIIGTNLADHDTGPDRDLSGYEGADALHSAQEEDVLELQGTEQEVLTEVRNIIERAEVAATMDGKKAFIEAYNSGDTQSQCQTAAETAVNDFFTNREQSVVSRFSQAANLIKRRFSEIESHSNLALSDVWEIRKKGYTIDDSVETYYDDLASNFTTATYTCYNGTTIDYTYYSKYGSTYVDVIDPFGSGEHGIRAGYFKFSKYSDNSQMSALSTEIYIQIMDKIATTRDRTIGNMATYVDEAFSALERGEISTDDLLNHYDIQQEFSTNKEDTGYHGWLAWEFYSLGMETDLQHNAVLSFPESEDSTQLEGTLFVSSAEPIGGTIDVGTTYDPTQWGGESAFFTYSRVVTDQADIAEQEEIAKEHSDGSYTVIGKIQIKEKFVVEKLYNVQTGDEIDSTTTEKTNDQNYDPEQLQAEIDRLNEQITEMQENAEAEESGDGGSGIPSPEISLLQGTGIVGLGLSVLYALSGRSDDKPPGRGR
jgi:hypothetical protein